MDVLLTLGLIAGGCVIIFAVKAFSAHRQKEDSLPSDPLADYFIKDDESV